MDKTDADFVDIIHTAAGTLGYEKPLGHSDFYPNNGRASQPGCEGIMSELLGKSKNVIEMQNTLKPNTHLQRHAVTVAVTTTSPNR